MFAPRTTPAGTPPTRSASAARAAATNASARPDAGNTPPRSATGRGLPRGNAPGTPRQAHRLGDRAGHGLGQQRPGRPVGVHEAVRQGGEQAADARDVEPALPRHAPDPSARRPAAPVPGGTRAARVAAP